ncbi:MAG: sensor histidine kinase [Coprococcus sp.]
MKVLLPIILVLLLGVEFSAILAYRLSKQITTPLEAIDLDHPDESTVYDELSPFIRKIRIQNEQIQKAMTQLQTQKNEFALITENMQEGFLVVDKKEIVLSHNRSISTLFDVDESVDGKHVLEINRSEEFIDCIKKAIQGIHSEYICPVKGRFYNIYANPVFRNNEVAGAVVIITDVTEKEERENLRREFSANVSHELKTPLTSISGIAEIIKNGIVDEKDVKTFAGKIYDEARRLIHLVEDIIKLSQLDEGEQAVEKTPIDIYDLSRIEIHHLEPVAEERHIKINLQGEHMMISGIHSVLEEMVYNLIENAIKYNKEDGTIDVMIKKEKHRCEFCVKDSGIGIPADQLDRIFERFYRVDKSHSKEIGGTGLGLSIVKHGAKLHNAEIKIESALNVGTEINLIFPI